MSDTKKNSAGEQQPIDEMSRYASMSTAELKSRQTIDLSNEDVPRSLNAKTKAAIRKYSDDPERDIAEYGGLERKPRKIIKLPKKEYAELCSAIRTRYADNIPMVGRIFNGDYFYLFRYNRNGERISCTFKIPIVGNENIISELME